MRADVIRQRTLIVSIPSQDVILYTGSSFVSKQCGMCLMYMVLHRHSQVHNSWSTFSSPFFIHFLSFQGRTLAMVVPEMRASGRGPKCLESREAGRLSPDTQQ